MLIGTTALTGFTAGAADGFHTTLDRLAGLNGTWRETDTGLYAEGGGDNFALSQTAAADFVLQAQATFHQRGGAASLVFFAGDQPAQKAYCANVDLNNKNARIFRFGYTGGDLGQRSLPDSMREQESYTLRVEAVGETVNYFVDDLLYTGIYSQEMTPMADGRIKMRVVVDTSVIEAFGNDGQAANADLFFPDPASIGMELFTNGSLTVDSLDIYGMKSIWHSGRDGALQASGPSERGAAFIDGPRPWPISVCIGPKIPAQTACAIRLSCFKNPLYGELGKIILCDGRSGSRQVKHNVLAGDTGTVAFILRRTGRKAVGVYIKNSPRRPSGRRGSDCKREKRTLFPVKFFAFCDA